MNDNKPDLEFEKQLNTYIAEEKSKLDIKPNGFYGNMAFYSMKRREFTNIWKEARERDRKSADDSFE